MGEKNNKRLTWIYNIYLTDHFWVRNKHICPAMDCLTYVIFITGLFNSGCLSPAENAVGTPEEPHECSRPGKICQRRRNKTNKIRDRPI